MGGVSVEGGKGGRRTVDSEVNMIPMIDLLMVTISFLLITAVWTHLSRINADAAVPGPPRPDTETTEQPKEKQLHVSMQADKFILNWKEGSQSVDTMDVTRKDNPAVAGKSMMYPDLAAQIETQWKKNGAHRDATDKKFDQAILHVDNETPYSLVIGVIDAIYSPHRPYSVGGKVEQMPSFNVTFAVN
jgi:biopolymer transport protein ExbD